MNIYFSQFNTVGNLERSIMKSINVDMDNYDKMTVVYHSDLVDCLCLSGLLDGSDTSIKVDFDVGRLVFILY